jgi:hypothetical protein
LEVVALNYGVRWLPERHPIRWAANVFPVELVIPGWKLRLSETELKARPDGCAFNDEGPARADLEPNLQGWAASAEVVDHIRMEFFFLDAEMRPIAPVSLYGVGRLQVGATDFGTSREDLTVEIVLKRVPMPLWQDESPAAREAREYCLRPMRALRRPQVLADLDPWRWAPAFVFADQQAAEIHWETLRKIAAFRNGKTKAEIWLLTSPSMVAKGVAGQTARCSPHG